MSDIEQEGQGEAHTPPLTAFDIFNAAMEVLGRVLDGSGDFETFELGRRELKREGMRRPVHYLEVKDEGKVPLRIEIFTIEPIPVVDVEARTFVEDGEGEGSIVGNPSVIQEEGEHGSSIVD